ncbi:polyribonucleotide nucleotidyltransferase [Candidatus Saccharibacteria bacterium]|nr:polyribonucleotide nucleotidyltransferase [Candidatus Saccharibacteria bacterium]
MSIDDKIDKDSLLFWTTEVVLVVAIIVLILKNREDGRYGLLNRFWPMISGVFPKERIFMEIINPSGKKTLQVSTEWLGRKLTLEVNRVGFRSTSSVLVTYGDTVVLGSVVVGTKPVVQDFFPLSIDYEEKWYAAGKISGSRFIKREGKPADEAVLVGRLIDRPIRPLFPKGYRQEVQVVCTVLSMDPSFRPDCVAMIAASSALMNAGVPFDGPVTGVRIGRVGGEFKAFLNEAEREMSPLDLVVACKDGKVMMVEAGAKEVPEEMIIEAMHWAVKEVQPVLDLQRELAKQVNAPAQEYELVLPDEEILEEVKKWTEGKFGSKIRGNVMERAQILDDLKYAMHDEFALLHGEGETDNEKVEWYDENLRDVYDQAFELALYAEVRRGIVEEGVRPDGRKLTEVRPLSSQVGILPRVHGSSLFTRGVTQAMNIVTLAPLSYSQEVDTMEVTDGKRRYMHHYNAPSYTVGECGRMGSPGRREIGHGYLAERALLPVLPSEEDFPYAIRSVTEIMSQNGSTSMAATCSSCMALMDAGVPLKRPVSGVAMGLMVDVPKGEPITEADIDKAYVLTDLMDAEDFAGDMDFKVTGTTEGITALQMDMKVHGLPVEIMEKALKQSHDGRMFILDHLVSVINAPREKISDFAPRIEKIQVAKDKIGAIIGKGGETINKITSETGAEVDIEDSGLVTVSGTDMAKIQAAMDWIKSLVEEPEVGKIYNGTVVAIKDFGAFVNILNGVDGMLHISQIADKRLNKVEEVLHVGDKVRVRLVAIDDKGKISLSMKGIDK